MGLTEKSAIRRFAPLAGYPALIATLDQYTKYLIRQNFGLYESMEVVKGFFSITHVENRGAAFSFMAGTESEWVSRALVAVSFAAILLITAIYREVETQGRVLKVSLIMILGGAAGNLIDRVRMGKVTDFLDFQIFGYHWPAFNVADSCITVGVAMLAGAWILHAYPDKGGEGASRPS